MSKRSRPGIDARANKRLACAVCGLPWLRDKMELWVMQMHMELWHGTDKVDLIIREKNTPLNVPEPIDMATSQEILATLDKLADATREARAATSEAHTATKDLKHTLRETLRELDETVEKAVATAVEKRSYTVDDEIRAEMRKLLDQINTDLREKLGLVR